MRRVAMGDGCMRGGQVLNCVVRVVTEGFEMEVDQRHAELIIERLHLQAEEGVTIPGI